MSNDPCHVDRQDADLRDDERALLSRVDGELAKSLALARWWRRHGGSGPDAHRFELIATQRGEGAYGIHQTAEIPGLGTFPVSAAVQKIPFTRPKSLPGEERAAARWTARQVREFALRYLLRSTSFAKAQSYPDLGQAPLPAYLRLLSWCPVEGVEIAGAEISQLYFKRRGGRLGKFTEHRRQTIVDMREIGPVYDWVLLSAQFFDASINLSLSGPDSPTLSLPLRRRIYMALTPELIFDQDADSTADGSLGRFGPGFVYLEEDPNAAGSFTPAFETIVLEVAETGETELQMVAVVRRPGVPIRIWIDPRRLLALLSGSVSAEEIGHRFLYQHLLEQRYLAFISMNVWNLTPDWLDEAEIPQWLRAGLSGAIGR